MRLHNRSIKMQLCLITTLTTILALWVAFAGFVVYDLSAFKNRLTQDLSTLATIIGSNSTAALTFKDHQAAAEILSALKARPEVMAASLFDEKGKLFASYDRKGGTVLTVLPRSGRPGAWFEGGTLQSVHPVEMGGELLGNVYVKADSRQWNDRLRSYLGIIALLTLVSALIALFLASRLQRVISDPILHLVTTMKSVSEEQTYGHRVEKTRNDEIGTLTDEFNAMLSEVERRDYALKHANDELEERVMSRTQSLTQVNESLETEIADRKRAQEELRTIQDGLEHRVRQRTEDLAAANGALQLEIEERRRTEIALMQAKERAEAANIGKSRFLANMSHELRTPLNAIIGFSELLPREAFGGLNEKQTKFAMNITNSGRHLLLLINTILDLAKVEAGHEELRCHFVDMADVLKATTEVAKGLASKKDIRLSVEYDLDLPTIVADDAKVKQVLYNLLSNAIKFSPEGSVVAVSARTYKNSAPESQVNLGVLVSVKDSGIGIRLADQERIFQEFEQVDSSYSRTQQGTGLGLTLTQRLVELHGGKIWVESAGEGCGSTFSFILPIDPTSPLNVEAGDLNKSLLSDNESPGKEADSGMDESNSAPDIEPAMQVLIIEDNPVNMELATEVMITEGYRVLQADNAETGIALAISERPAVILMDIALPGMDGLQATTILKADPRTTHIPVIALTAHAMVGDEQRAFSVGCAAYVTKPIDMHVLATTVARLVTTLPAGPELELCIPGALK
jgi:signal transduction histidine kinase/CheY-like chemotaxis protein